MKTEFLYLLSSVGLLVFIHLIEVFHTLLALGPVRALSGVVPINLSPWRQRLSNTATNLTQNLVIFGILLFLADARGISTFLTVLGSALFFYGRLAHAIAYTFRIPFLRAPTYLTGLAGCVVIAIALFP